MNPAGCTPSGRNVVASLEADGGKPVAYGDALSAIRQLRHVLRNLGEDAWQDASVEFAEDGAPTYTVRWQK